MTEDERWRYINRLDDELLVGGVILPEWCAFLVRQADLAFASGLDLPAILTAIAAIEAYLRGEGHDDARQNLASAIDSADLPAPLRAELHQIRQYRNRWVHVKDPWNDAELLAHPEATESELEGMAVLALRVLRATLYANQWL